MKISDRIGALSGAAYVVFAVIGNQLIADPTAPGKPTGDQVVANLQWMADNPIAQLGLSLELLGWVGWMFFVAYLWQRTRHAGWLATAGLVAGTIAIAVKVVSGAPLITA